MPETNMHFSSDCPNCHGVGYLGMYSPILNPNGRLTSAPSAPTALSYPDDPSFNAASSPTLCTWCNSGTAKAAPKWQGGHLSMGASHSLSSSAMNSPCYPPQGNTPDSWNMVLPLGRSPAILPYPSAVDNVNRSFSSSPGSATDLSPSTYSEAKGYFDFIPIQNARYDHSAGQPHSAPISPGSLSVSDNDLVNVNDMGSMSREFCFHLGTCDC